MKIPFTALLFAAMSLQAETSIDDQAIKGEQAAREQEERIHKALKDLEGVRPIPDRYAAEKKPFLAKEGSSPVNSSSDVYRFGNPTKKTIYFFGYTPSQPISRFQEFRKGRWTDLPNGHCGTGLAIRSLKPGESTLIQKEKKFSSGTFRFGVDLLEDGHSTSVAVTVWSH